MNVLTLIVGLLLYFHLHAMSIGISVLANARHLPAYLHVWLIGLNYKCIALHLFLHNGLGKGSDHRELVVEVLIQRIEIGWHCNSSISVSISNNVAVVDVHHIRTLHEGMIEILVGRIKRMVNLEST